jgi:hypothetical protein
VLSYPSLPGIQWVMALAPEDEGHVYYANPFANNRVAAEFDAIVNVSAYETFTPCDTPACDKMSEWRWRPSTFDNPSGWHGFGSSEERTALKKGLLKPDQARYQVRDVLTGKPMHGGLARGSINWNSYRKKYILVSDKGMNGGASSESNYGELWYCESAALTGPWTDCVRAISHAGTGSSCYNPLQLQFMDEAGGEAVYIACTFTSMWSSQQKKPKDKSCEFSDYGGQGCSVAVPRYEYNNLVYKLNLTQQWRRSVWKSDELIATAAAPDAAAGLRYMMTRDAPYTTPSDGMIMLHHVRRFTIVMNAMIDSSETKGHSQSRHVATTHYAL